MQLSELIAGCAIVGALSAIVVSAAPKAIERAQYGQAYVDLGAALKIKECPPARLDWHYDCIQRVDGVYQIVSRRTNGLTLTGYRIDDSQIAICKGFVTFKTTAELLEDPCGRSDFAAPQ